MQATVLRVNTHKLFHECLYFRSFVDFRIHIPYLEMVSILFVALKLLLVCPIDIGWLISSAKVPAMETDNLLLMFIIAKDV